MDVLHKAKTLISREQLAEPHARLLVAVSGGMDSVVLLDVLVRLGFDCVIAHCNFHLRDQDADADATFVEQLAKKYDLPLKRADFDTLTIAHDRKISVEMAARDLRYTWFEEIRQSADCQHIAVAHHANDNTETMLLNLARGASINGIRGMLPKNGHIVRPLLDCTRSEIAKYAENQKLTYRTDATNADTRFRRNFIRHEIVPRLEQLNPLLVETTARNARHLTDVAAIYNDYIEKEKRNLLIHNGNTHEISIAKLEQTVAPQTLLYELLKEFGFTNDTTDNLYHNLHTQSGKLFASRTHTAATEREKIIIKNCETTENQEITITSIGEIFTPIHLKIEAIERPQHIDKAAHFAYFDADKLPFPLTLRRWRKGDTFVPFGMNGRKKVSDFFIDSKIARFDKENIWLLTTGNDIAWIVGRRTDNRFRITPTTTRALKLTFFIQENASPFKKNA